jgi:hypothetical protein
VIRREYVVRGAGALLLFLGLALLAPPSAMPYSLCGFHWLTGRPCPLCGLTRGVFALAHGHFVEASRLNALTPLAFAMLFSLFWRGPARDRLWRGGALAFAVYGAGRVFFPV